MDHLIASHRTRPTDDPIFSLDREAQERAKKGEPIINGTIGVLLDDAGKLSLMPTVNRLLKEIPETEWSAYAPIAGLASYTQSVLDDLFAELPAMRPWAVAAATPGGSGALRHAIANYLEPGNALLTTSSYWSPYGTLADESDRRVETFNTFAEGGAFDLAALDAAMAKQIASQGRVLLFLNDPCHNPSGYSLSDAEYTELTAILARHGKSAPVTVLIDSAYAVYAPDGARPLRHLGAIADTIQVLLAWSASKTFALYGMRVGAIVALVPDEAKRVATQAAFSYSCRGTWSNCNRGGQALVARILGDAALHADVKRERAELVAGLDRRVAIFNEHAKKAGLRYPRYDGGFFVSVFDDNPKARGAQMRATGVFVVPQATSLRIALCAVREGDIPRLVEAFARPLASS
jgi:aromatic-amino-acid transaminase